MFSSGERMKLRRDFPLNSPNSHARKRVLGYYLIVVAAIFTAGCHSSGGNGELLFVGSFGGKVALYGEDITPLEDLSGVTISADGPTHLNTITGSDGKWILKDLRKGLYTVTFTKERYGMNRMLSVNCSGISETDLGKTIMVQKPRYLLDTLSITTSDSDFQISGSFAVPPDYNYGAIALFFLDTTSMVSSDPHHYIGTLAAFTRYPSTTYSLRLSKLGGENNLKLGAGTAVYVAAYAASALYGFSGYADTSTGNWNYTAISDSFKTGSFIMP